MLPTPPAWSHAISRTLGPVTWGVVPLDATLCFFACAILQLCLAVTFGECSSLICHATFFCMLARLAREPDVNSRRLPRGRGSDLSHNPLSRIPGMVTTRRAFQQRRLVLPRQHIQAHTLEIFGEAGITSSHHE